MLFMNSKEEKITAAQVGKETGGTYRVDIEPTPQAYMARNSVAEDHEWGDAPRLSGLTQEQAEWRAGAVNEEFRNLFRRTS